MSNDQAPAEELTVMGALPVASELPPDATPGDQAAAVGLIHVNDDEPGIARQRCGKGFTYRYPDGRTVPRDHPDRQRAEGLVIPPAWTDVWVCTDADGHIQATGRDQADRKQYLYHRRWRGIRDATKFHRMTAFADALPRIRDAVDQQLRARGFSRRRVLALMLAVLDETLIRVGSDQYVRANGTFGLTTLESDHVTIDGSRVRFSFVGKAGHEHELEVRHPRLARQLLRCEDIPGQRLFSYADALGWHEVASSDVNEYLAELAGDALTAKDFRTWGATVIVADRLHELGPAASARRADARVLEAIDLAADRLGNTRAVARSSYLDPRILAAYRQHELDGAWDEHAGENERLSPAERAVARMLAMDAFAVAHDDRDGR